MTDDQLLTQLFAIVSHKQWWLLVAVLIGLVVRIVKDSRVPIRLPPRARPVLALVLGMVSGTIAKVGTGLPWKTALAGGAIASVIAIVGHVFGIEVLRDGKEIFPAPPLFPPPPTGPSSVVPS